MKCECSKVAYISRTQKIFAHPPGGGAKRFDNKLELTSVNPDKYKIRIIFNKIDQHF